MQLFLQPRENVTCEFVEKKSRFITDLAVVNSAQQAADFIASIKKKYSDARHHCSAYRVYKPFCERYSDDGEPQGTAGAPILSVLRKEDIMNVCVVVTRYFGGVLLGAAGLTRAYARAAADGVNAAQIVSVRSATLMRLTLPYSYHDFTEHTLLNYTYKEQSKQFSSCIEWELWLPDEEFDLLAEGLKEGSAGHISIKRGGQSLTSFDL